MVCTLTTKIPRRSYTPLLVRCHKPERVKTTCCVRWELLFSDLYIVHTHTVNSWLNRQKQVELFSTHVMPFFLHNRTFNNCSKLVYFGLQYLFKCSTRVITIDIDLTYIQMSIQETISLCIISFLSEHFLWLP